MKRRTLLGSLSTVGAAAVSGCLELLPSGRSKTRLARLSVVNFDTDDARTIDVRVERDGSVVHSATYTVAEAQQGTASSTIADCTWDDVAGTYVIGARLAGSAEWQWFSLADEAEGSPGCLIGRVQYGDFPLGPDADSLSIDVMARCDEIGVNYAGGCPAYTTNGTEKS